jgi:hypothetical protein
MPAAKTLYKPVMGHGYGRPMCLLRRKTYVVREGNTRWRTDYIQRVCFNPDHAAFAGEKKKQLLEAFHGTVMAPLSHGRGIPLKL